MIWFLVVFFSSSSDCHPVIIDGPRSRLIRQFNISSSQLLLNESSALSLNVPSSLLLPDHHVIGDIPSISIHAATPVAKSRQNASADLIAIIRDTDMFGRPLLTPSMSSIQTANSMDMPLLSSKKSSKSIRLKKSIEEALRLAAIQRDKEIRKGDVIVLCGLCAAFSMIGFLVMIVLINDGVIKLK